MQTLTIKINNSKTLKLLEDLEALSLIVINRPIEKEKINKPPGKSKISEPETKNAALRKLLLNGPVFTNKQIKAIEETHKSINEWRRK